MNLTLPIKEFEINHVFFQAPITNTIMTDSDFIRLIYSNELCILTGVCLEFTLNISYIDKSFNKYKCLFNASANSETLNTLNKIEYSILNKLQIKNKKPTLRIQEQLKNGFIKVLHINNNTPGNTTFVIKISGIWENTTEYGLTYKFCNN